MKNPSLLHGRCTCKMKIDIHKNVNCAPFVRQYVILETNGVLYHAKRENQMYQRSGLDDLIRNAPLYHADLF